ncbi:hypothetical protein DL93DRAFT_2164061 [Clavulina sp. PMI_390]|nr:hypothetical protein DL93DRAFT_2164061 [Clavulina sp. PMI_390]
MSSNDEDSNGGVKWIYEGPSRSRKGHDQTHSLIVKAHRCQECDRSFDRPSSLVQHMFTHTGERPHPCGYCHVKRFATTSNLYRHMRGCAHNPEKGEYQRVSSTKSDLPSVLSASPVHGRRRSETSPKANRLQRGRSYDRPSRTKTISASPDAREERVSSPDFAFTAPRGSGTLPSSMTSADALASGRHSSIYPTRAGASYGSAQPFTGANSADSRSVSPHEPISASQHPSWPHTLSDAAPRGPSTDFPGVPMAESFYDVKSTSLDVSGMRFFTAKARPGRWIWPSTKEVANEAAYFGTMSSTSVPMSRPPIASCELQSG